jgi:hypothetical protein
LQDKLRLAARKEEEVMLCRTGNEEYGYEKASRGEVCSRGMPTTEL